MFYEEFHDGAPRRLKIGGEMLTGRAHHVIFFGSRAEWAKHPEWARGRRTEIVSRIKSAFPIPDYEYMGEAVLDARDRDLLVEAAGGLSGKQCIRAGCPERALRGKQCCPTHLYPDSL